MNRAEAPERGPPSFHRPAERAACDRAGARHQASAEPWLTLTAISAGYLLLIPVGLISYARIRRQRAERSAASDRAPAAPPPQ